MSRRPWSSRFALWAAVCALLLKAAVPMLASASAEARGLALVEVCTVYGVATVALDGGEPAAPQQHPAAHAGDHCALSAVMALAAPQPLLLGVATTPSEASALSATAARSSRVDASAHWLARLHHGPPSLG